MVIRPRVRGFICTTAHPLGCAAHVREQIAAVRSRGAFGPPPRNVLVIGCSGGYGMASRVVAAFGAGARTLGLSFEKAPGEGRTGTAGWYNNHAFDQAARAAGLWSETIDADAFADATRAEVVRRLRADLGPIDLLVYSLASPVRVDPRDGVLYRSAIKPLGQAVHMKSVNVERGEVIDVDLQPATDEETRATVKVMGGEDWELWVDLLAREGLLADGFRTLAYTYIGSELTWPIYWEATLGKAKEDLDRAAAALRARLAGVDGDARVAVLKAVMTQASAAIPVVPLYNALLFKVMQEQGVHETVIEHIDRLLRQRVYGGEPNLDAVGRIRVDERELAPAVQAEVRRRFAEVSTASLPALGDLARVRADFLRVFGFGLDGVDYEADVAVDATPSA